MGPENLQLFEVDCIFKPAESDSQVITDAMHNNISLDMK